jgi:hypothetical protein
MPTYRLATFCFAISLSLSALPLLAQPAMPPDPATADIPVGPPTGMLPTNDKPFEMKVTVLDKNKMPVTRTVRIPTNPADPNQPPIMIWRPSAKRADETFMQWYGRLRDERAEFSRKKAAAIAYAVNKTFDDVFKDLGKMAEVGQEAVTDSYGPKFYGDVNRDQLWGQISIPNVDQKVNPKTGKKEGVMFGPNPMGELGDGTRFRSTSPSSPGSRGAMMRNDSSPSFASGLDLNGDPSFVELGIREQFVAAFQPSPGMTDVDVLTGLSVLLNANGIPATYNPLLSTLSLDNLIPNGQTFAFGNSDPGLDFTFSFQGSYEVPEPSSLALAAIGLFWLRVIRRRP